MEKKPSENESTSQIGPDFTQSEHKDTNTKHKSKTEESLKILELEKQAAQLKDALVRSLADAENLKKRHEKDLESTAKYASAKLLKDLIEPYEQLFMAMQFSNDLAEKEEAKPLINGLQMTQKAFEKALEINGLNRIYPINEPFNHDLHQAISQVKQEGIVPNVVLNVVQAGFTLNGRIIKPAMVVVSV